MSNRQERAHSVLGVDGRMFAAVERDKAKGTFYNQTWKASRPDPRDSNQRVTIEVRFDDNCGNGHNTFSVTGEVRDIRYKGDRGFVSGGQCIEDISAAFPELVPLLKWHLVSTDGPMHYLANTIYQASDRDHNGRAKGEPSRWEHRIYFGDSPIGHDISGKLAAFIQARLGTGSFQVVGIAHDKDSKTYGTHYTLVGFGEKWHEAPFRHERGAQEFAAALNQCAVRIEKIPTEYSEGKARELRRPGRTIAQMVLCAPSCRTVQACA